MTGSSAAPVAAAERLNDRTSRGRCVREPWITDLSSHQGLAGVRRLGSRPGARYRRVLGRWVKVFLGPRSTRCVGPGSAV